MRNRELQQVIDDLKVKDGDDLHGDEVSSFLVIACRRNGAMSVQGDINNKAFALAMLDNAKDSIKSHHTRNKLNGGSPVIIPPSYTGLAS